MFSKSFEKPCYWASVPIRHGPSEATIFRVAARVAGRFAWQGAWQASSRSRVGLAVAFAPTQSPPSCRSALSTIEHSRMPGLIRPLVRRIPREAD